MSKSCQPYYTVICLSGYRIVVNFYSIKMFNIVHCTVVLLWSTRLLTPCTAFSLLWNSRWSASFRTNVLLVGLLWSTQLLLFYISNTNTEFYFVQYLQKVLTGPTKKQWNNSAKVEKSYISCFYNQVSIWSSWLASWSPGWSSWASLGLASRGGPARWARLESSSG